VDFDSLMIKETRDKRPSSLESDSRRFYSKLELDYWKTVKVRYFGIEIPVYKKGVYMSRNHDSQKTHLID